MDEEQLADIPTPPYGSENEAKNVATLDAQVTSDVAKNPIGYQQPAEAVVDTDENERSADVEEPHETSELVLLKEISDVMKDDPAVNSMLDVVRQTPDIFAEIQPVLARRDEFAATALPDEAHRALTPLFAGIAMSRRGSELLSLALDHHTTHEAARLWEVIKSGQTYVSELVVGSGIHAQIYNSSRMAGDPENPALTIEASETTGGQFAVTEGPVFRTNTRTRAEDASLPNVPGSAGSLNHYEGPGVLQQADITGLAYGTNDTLALPARVNHMLFSKVLNHTDVVKVEENVTDTSERPGLYLVTLRHKDTGEELTITTDRIVFATGLGEPEIELKTPDETTLKIIEEERIKFENGEDAQVMTFHQFASRVGDESHPFPIQPYEWVAVAGPGDSGAVAVEYLLGHGPDTRMSAAQLDQVKQVFWIGQRAQTREELSKATRLRYISLSLEMPLDGDSGYAHRITPIAGRALRMERTEDGRIKVVHGIDNEDGTFTPVSDVVVDHLILATGFTDETEKICAPVVSSIEGSETTEEVTTEEGWAVAKRFKGTQIYKVGPAAELLVSKQDISDSPAMRKEGGRGKEITKTVAVWASAEETAEAARLLGTVKPVSEQLKSLTTVETAESPPVELKEFSTTDTPETTQVKIEVPADSIRSVLRHDVVSEDVARLSVGTSLHRYIFPPGLEGLRLTARQLGEETESCAFEIAVEPSLPETTEYSDMLSDVLNQPMLQAVLVRLTSKSIHSSQTAVLDIPLTSRKVSVGEVEIRIKRR